jgi:DNA-binding NtrC family response regulator
MYEVVSSSRLVATGMVTSGETCSAPREGVFVRDEAISLVNNSLEVKAAVELQEATILIVDDNRQLCTLLEAEFEEAGWMVQTAETAQQARELVAERHPTTVLLDYLLGEEDGLALGLQLQTQAPGMQIIIMTGGALTADELSICEERQVPVLYKPFLAEAVLNLARGQHHRASAAVPG